MIQTKTIQPPDFLPSPVAFDNRYRIGQTKWSCLQHTNTMWFYYHDDFLGLRGRKEITSEHFHMTLCYRFKRNSDGGIGVDDVDHHATHVYRDQRMGRWFKRHHGFRFNKKTGKQEFKYTSKPKILHDLFKQFENDILLLGLNPEVVDIIKVRRQKHFDRISRMRRDHKKFWKYWKKELTGF